jgi:hypothetical protein
MSVQMIEVSILVHTTQRFPLHFSYEPAFDLINASLYQRPSPADRKRGLETGSTLVFVAGARAQRICLDEPIEEGDGWVAWLASTAFDIDEPTHARLSAWIAETFAGDAGSASR